MLLKHTKFQITNNFFYKATEVATPLHFPCGHSLPATPLTIFRQYAYVNPLSDLLNS